MIDIKIGDCREKLKELPNNFFHTVITSPPYWGLRDYGTGKWTGGNPNCSHIAGKSRNDADREFGTKETLTVQYRDVCKDCGAVRQDNQIGMEPSPEEYVRKIVRTFQEVKRVLRPDGTLWLNLGDSYSSGGRTSTTNQSVRGDKDYGVTRPPVSSSIKPKDLVGIPWRVALALQEDGWYLRQDIIWHKPNPMPESVKDRCTKSHEYIFLFSKNRKYFYDNEAIKEPVKKDWGTRNRTNGKYHNTGTGLQPHSGLTKSYDRKNKRSVWLVEEKSHGKYGSQENEAKHRQGIHANRGDNLIAVRTKLPTQKEFVEFLRSKTNAKVLAENTDIPLTKIEHWFRFDNSGFAYPTIEDWKKVRKHIDDYDVMDEGLTYFELKTDEVAVSDKKNKRSVWSITNKPYKGAHFATYPPDLIEPCILAGSEKGDIILDPFMGSGTTAMVAKSLGRDYIGCELHEDYGNLIQKRVQEYKPVKEVTQEGCINILDII